MSSIGSVKGVPYPGQVKDLLNQNLYMQICLLQTYVCSNEVSSL